VRSAALRHRCGLGQPDGGNTVPQCAQQRIRNGLRIVTQQDVGQRGTAQTGAGSVRARSLLALAEGRR
jgi:hypothetical protein